MKHIIVYILIFLCIASVTTSCNVLKRVEKNEHLLIQNKIIVDGEKENSEAINNLISQRPNSELLNFPLRLHIYNLARPNRDSLFEVWLNKNPKRRNRLEKRYSKKQVNKLKESALGFNSWLRKTGEAPVVIDTSKTNKSINSLSVFL